MHNQISIHAPRTGSDFLVTGTPCQSYFNPRSPHGERPSPAAGSAGARSHFNPRSPHGERHRGFIMRRIRECISIHAPRTGSDSCPFRACPRLDLFQSTLPARGATPSSGGEFRGGAFQSTLPARGATVLSFPLVLLCVISIHAPRTGSDVSTCTVTRCSM